jgi:hypothetical protein
MLNIKSLGLVIVAAGAICTPALADERAVNTIAGAALGAAIGNHNGGRDGAIIGGVIGAAIGNSVSTRDNGYATTYYEPRRVAYVETRYQQPVYVEPAPVYYSPAPAYYYEPAPRYYAPAVVYVDARYGRGYRHGHGHR